MHHHPENRLLPAHCHDSDIRRFYYTFNILQAKGPMMSFPVQKELSTSNPMPDAPDMTEFDVGCDFAISPEIIDFLIEQKLIGPMNGFCHHPSVSRQLDEHELAIG
ncbi:MAG: hypothetical protein ACU841_15480 [Gammaproteobacteria bacterium]